MKYVVLVVTMIRAYIRRPQINGFFAVVFLIEGNVR